MEERINLIKEKLTGNYKEDVEYLTTLYNAQYRVLEDTTATIEAITTVLKEITDVQENNEKVEEEVVKEEEKEETPNEENDKSITNVN